MSLNYDSDVNKAFKSSISQVLELQMKGGAGREL